jgi:hypothetical protein
VERGRKRDKPMTLEILFFYLPWLSFPFGETNTIREGWRKG